MSSMTTPTSLDSRLCGNDMVGMVLLCVMPASGTACPSYVMPDLIGHPREAAGAIDCGVSAKGMS